MKVHLPYFSPPELARIRTRSTPDLSRGASGGPKYPMLPFAGEISHRCFDGCQKYNWRRVKSVYESSPAKLHLGYVGPPERRRSTCAAGGQDWRGAAGSEGCGDHAAARQGEGAIERETERPHQRLRAKQWLFGQMQPGAGAGSPSAP